MLILDGVYTQNANGPLFHRVTAPDTKTLERLLNRLVHLIVRWASCAGSRATDSSSKTQNRLWLNSGSTWNPLARCII